LQRAFKTNAGFDRLDVLSTATGDFIGQYFLKSRRARSKEIDEDLSVQIGQRPVDKL
jgi:hypothetical protein